MASRPRVLVFLQACVFLDGFWDVWEALRLRLAPLVQLINFLQFGLIVIDLFLKYYASRWTAFNLFAGLYDTRAPILETIFTYIARIQFILLLVFFDINVLHLVLSVENRLLIGLVFMCGCGCLLWSPRNSRRLAILLIF